MKFEIIPYKRYSFFDNSFEASYMWRERLKYKESFYTEEDKRIIEKNTKYLGEIFTWLRRLSS